MISERAPDPRSGGVSAAFGSPQCGPLNPSPEECRGASAAFAELGRAVHGVLGNGWEDGPRRRVWNLSAALMEATKKAGWKDASDTLGALTSLLALPIEQVLFGRIQIRDRLLDLLARLMEITQEPADGPQGR